MGDADGNPLSVPAQIELDSALGVKIKDAFSLNPTIKKFYPGDCVDVTVAVSNPGAGSAEYGDYVVVMKAQAVGSGSRYTLRLRPATLTDVDPPVVTISSPFNNYTLGPVPVRFKAIDPAIGPTNSAPGTGVASMSATVSSIGNAVTAVKAVDNQSVTLTITPSLPVDAGVEVTGTGTFTPTGGTGPKGTGIMIAFFDAIERRSGIGTYTLTATATDRAAPPNTGTAASNFNVNYDLSFTKADATGGQNPTGQFHFTVRRRDGTFMYDQTVVVQLIRVSDNAVMKTYYYGTGAVHSCVQIDAPEYKTHFRRSDLSGSPASAAAYKARVLFLDVDGNLIQQAESAAVRF